MGLIQNIVDFFTSERRKIKKYKKQVKEQKKKVKELAKRIDKLEEVVETRDEKKEELQEKLKQLGQEIEKLPNDYKNSKLLKEYTNKLEKYWNSKYKTTVIKYAGRSLPFSNEKIKVPVNVLVTPNDGDIIKDLKEWELYDTDEDSDTLAPKIYKKIHDKFYKYQYDNNVWGNAEVWEFPYEMRANGFSEGYDCDSWGIFQASYYIAAGIPRWKVRCVPGLTSIKGENGRYIGHLTVYIYSEKDDKWHHLNSTYGGKLMDNVQHYPTHRQAKEGNDTIGIRKPWFSFNDKNCWYRFKSDLPKDFEPED